MAIKFACPSCGKAYNVKDGLAGKKAKCKCGAVMPIPAAAAAPVASDPLFADDPLGGDLFGDGSSSGTAQPGSGSLFDEEFPAGQPLPAAPVAYQAAAFPTNAYQAAALPTNAYQAASQPASPVQSASGYAVTIPTVGPITESSQSESTSMGGGAAFLIGVGMSGAGALLGAFVWALIAILTGFEIGWIAWGVGFCSGFGMAIAHNFSDAIDDFLGGVIAATMAILGILAGKYAVYQFVVLAMLNDLGEMGELIEGEISFGMMFGPMDALFFFLAVATAYKLGSGGDDDD